MANAFVPVTSTLGMSMPMPDKTKAALKSLLDPEEDRRRKRFQHLEAEFKNNPESLTDGDRLELIGLIVGSREIERVYYLEKLVTQLSFGINAIDSENVRTAWKDFLASGAMPEEWDATCDCVMARCFEQLGKTMHSISVYEYMLYQMIVGDPNYRDYAEDCLSKIFEYYLQSKSSRRAQDIVTLTTTYHESGLVSDDLYDRALRKETELFYGEMGEVIDRDRHLVEERLRLEMVETFDKLSTVTRSHLIDAELWSGDRLQPLEPSAGPRRWALVIEAEFHCKVYEQNKNTLDGILGDKRPRRRQTCGIGQILLLIEMTISNPMRRPLLEEKIALWPRLLLVPRIPAMLALIREHRNQIAHVAEPGIYTVGRSKEFVKLVRESGWLTEFLSALQFPTREH